MSTKQDQSTHDDMAFPLPCWSSKHGHGTQGSLLPHLTPVASTPGSTGPQVTVAGGLGPARQDAVPVIASAAVHQPPDGAQATGGGTLWATDAVRSLQTLALPAPPQMAPTTSLSARQTPAPTSQTIPAPKGLPSYLPCHSVTFLSPAKFEP